MGRGSLYEAVFGTEVSESLLTGDQLCAHREEGANTRAADPRGLRERPSLPTAPSVWASLLTSSNASLGGKDEGNERLSRGVGTVRWFS